MLPVHRDRAEGLPEAPHVMTGAEVCEFFKVDSTVGHPNIERIEAMKARFGMNELDHAESKTLFSLIYEQFQDFLIRILLMAAVVSFVLALVGGDDEGITAYVEPLVILLILIANAAVGVWQETNAEKALEALKSLQPEVARTLRCGKWTTIPGAEVVPGDIIEVRVGDRIPADIRLLKIITTSLRVEQSQLTGEAVPKDKDFHPMSKEDLNCEIQSKRNILFSSTTVSSGHAVGIVYSTGMNAELGLIQAAVKSASTEEEQTPLAQKIDAFGEWLSKVIGVICVVVWIINFKNFSDPAHGGFVRGCIYYFKIAVALAVAAIPEGLPAVITTCLALGTRKMAAKNAIVRRLPSVETLGCTTVICSDKTGTLTTNEMTCVRMCLPRTSHRMDVFKVEGVSYAPVGEIKAAAGSRGGSPKRLSLTKEEIGSLESPSSHHYTFEGESGREFFAKCASLCNEAKIEMKDNKYQRHGEPTEAAIRVLVEKIGCPDASLNETYLQKLNRDKPQAFSEYWETDVEVQAVLEFNRDRKSMSVLAKERGTHSLRKGANVMYVKGAPESILDRCTSLMLPDGTVTPLTSESREAIDEHVREMGDEALRSLAFACRLNCGELSDYDGPEHNSHHRLTNPDNFVEVEKEMTFLGLVGIMDPPRPEVPQAIEACNDAGIKVIMITGDNKLTAEAIAKKIGILSPLDLLSECSYTGREFELLDQDQKMRILSRAGGLVFSRTEPKHKQTIIKVLKEMDEITAMTGDGVNDAPALKQADIGIAMGITGTEVAKEASDMVLADDNFSSIVFAVEEGRSIYNNMKAFIRYLISSNIGEVASIFFTAALGIPEGLAPVQLLWVNLVTDGPPATALGFNPPDLDVMKKPPRHKNEALISGWVFFRYLVIGLYVGIATVGIFVWWYTLGVDPADGHTLVSFHQLAHWSQCQSWKNFTVTTVYAMDPTDPCSYFQAGKVKASTLSLTVLVVIEMLNALNALSQDGSLLQIPPWANPWLILAIIGSITIHLLILYIPFFNSIFNVVPLSVHDWVAVLLWSAPVILIDEFMKFVARWSQQDKGGSSSLARGKSRVVAPKKFQ
eukprot:GHVN01082811.1.p1 GENE.GHVN01082811.1~~GHVN01082811.1.p1  ORF type:complete len:1079 (+),score=163.66 GHVN01082811.1:914-4150(+)